MTAKKLLIASVIASLLTACGGNTANQAALPGDGTYDDTMLASDSSIGGDPATGGDLGGLPAPTGGATDPAAGGADGVIGDPTGAGFTLRGLVADMEGKPLGGAKVSIGAQTTLTNDKGEFEITGIMDSQVWVDVTKDGFEAINRFNVTFTTSKPTADKEFKLAAGSGTTTTPGTSPSGGGATPAAGPALSHSATFGGPKWKSITAMDADGDKVYVLGTIDKTMWFDRMAIVVYNAGTGEEVSRIGDVLFSKVPKSATSLRVTDGEVVVSDGSNRVTFDSAGTFVQKASGGSFEVKKVAIDATNGITYTLKSGNKVDVNAKTFTGSLKLEDVGNAKSIDLDDEGHLLVLDDGMKTVHQFTFE